MMMVQVIDGFKWFLIFMGILVVFFACIMSVLQVGNPNAYPDLLEQKDEDKYDYPGNEYNYLT